MVQDHLMTCSPAADRNPSPPDCKHGAGAERLTLRPLFAASLFAASQRMSIPS